MKHNWTKLIRWIAIVLIVLCAGYLIYWYLGSRGNRQASAAAVTRYVSSAPAAAKTTTAPAAETAQTQPAETTTAAPAVTVDFDALRQVSDSVVGWIRVSGIGVIDYPVVRKDDEYYLKHSWDDQTSRYGAIFMEEANNGDFSDYHTILYGHNMRDKSMFGDLSQYASADFFAQNGGVVTVYTPAGTNTYQIFSAEYVNATEPRVYTVGFSPSDEYTEFLRGMLDRSLYNTGVSVTTGDHVLTLSTCSYGEKTRFVVHARLVTP